MRRRVRLAGSWRASKVPPGCICNLSCTLRRNSGRAEGGGIFLLLFNLSVRPPWERVVVGSSFQPLGLGGRAFPGLVQKLILKRMSSCAREAESGDALRRKGGGRDCARISPSRPGAPAGPEEGLFLPAGLFVSGQALATLADRRRLFSCELPPDAWVIHRSGAPNHPAVFRADVLTGDMVFLLIDRPASIEFSFHRDSPSDGPDATSKIPA